MSKKTLKKDNIPDEKVIFLFEKMVKKWRNDSKKSDDHSKLGKQLFEAIARLSVSISFEAVTLRKNNGKTEIFLTKRRPQDTYAGQWHCPGSIFRPGEKPKDVLKRLEKKEFLTKIICNDYCIKDFFMPTEIGWMLCRVYLVTMAGDAKVGKWWNVKNLPKNIIPAHKKLIIPAALNHFHLH